MIVNCDKKIEEESNIFFGKMCILSQNPESEPNLISMLVPDSGMAAWNSHPGAKGTIYDLRRRGKGLSKGKETYLQSSEKDPKLSSSVCM
jgi:hypothetical protein